MRYLIFETLKMIFFYYIKLNKMFSSLDRCVYESSMPLEYFDFLYEKRNDTNFINMLNITSDTPRNFFSQVQSIITKPKEKFKQELEKIYNSFKTSSIIYGPEVKYSNDYSPHISEQIKFDLDWFGGDNIKYVNKQKICEIHHPLLEYQIKEIKPIISKNIKYITIFESYLTTCGPPDIYFFCITDDFFIFKTLKWYGHGYYIKEYDISYVLSNCIVSKNKDIYIFNIERPYLFENIEKSNPSPLQTLYKIIYENNNNVK